MRHCDSNKKTLRHTVLVILFVIAIVLVYCEFAIYYLTFAWQCSWPGGMSEQDARILMLADPHLLGRRAHWFDKLRREWQMYRSYQTARQLFRPEAVFVLGDLFDEGLWTSKQDFDGYVNRFHEVFRSDTIPVYAIIGNHDVGFHYELSPDRVKWFNGAFSSESVHMFTLKGSVFVSINSMAMDGDGCALCTAAERRIREINESLTCAQRPDRSSTCQTRVLRDYVQPIILQHFPLYRQSDAQCHEIDEAPPSEKNVAMRERWECLSKDSTSLLLNMLQPRAVFSGHTHHGCLTHHRAERVPEWSISSFSWRNKKMPSFLLVSVTPTRIQVSKCLVPNENTVVATYICTGLAILVWCLWKSWHYCRQSSRKNVWKKH